MTHDQATRDAADEWLMIRFPSYQKDRSVMHVDVEVFLAGATHERKRILAMLRSDNTRGGHPQTIADWIEARLSEGER